MTNIVHGFALIPQWADKLLRYENMLLIFIACPNWEVQKKEWDREQAKSATLLEEQKGLNPGKRYSLSLRFKGFCIWTGFENE